MADLLSREGHPLRARALTESVRRPDPRDLEPAPAPRRTFGMAAGAMLVLGTVVAGALGLNQAPDHNTPSAAAGEPVGALPGRGAPPAQPQPAQAAPEAPADPVQERFVNAASQSDPRASTEPAGRAGQIGFPAKVAPPAAAPKAPRTEPPAQQPKQPPAPEQPAPGPVQGLAEPVTDTVGGNTLSGVVAPVTSTVDDTLQPALSLIGGLLGR